MDHLFFNKIYNHPSIKTEDYKELMASHKKIDFSKNAIVLNEGKISNSYYLIESGLFRSFVIDFKGNEITTDFFSPNEILIEVPSLFLRTPSKENLQALTEASVWEMEFSDFQKLFSSIEGFTEWGRTWMSNQLFISKQRAVNMHVQSATERYLDLIKAQPKIIKQLPLKYIASYLGVTNTSLSRIRKEISLNS